MHAIERNAELCSGCRSCELVCSLKHYGYFAFEKSRIRILHEEERSVIKIHLCSQCAEKSCVNVCPVNALSIDSVLGCIRLDPILCTGCQACLKACKYNGVQWNYETRTPLICDLCDGDPECVKPCRLHGALTAQIKEVVK